VTIHPHSNQKGANSLQSTSSKEHQAKSSRKPVAIKLHAKARHGQWGMMELAVVASVDINTVEMPSLDQGWGWKWGRRLKVASRLSSG
jgi:hypothetical protein